MYEQKRLEIVKKRDLAIELRFCENDFKKSLRKNPKFPTFYGQDRWKTFVYEQKGLEIVKKRDLGVKNLDSVKINGFFFIIFTKSQFLTRNHVF